MILVQGHEFVTFPDDEAHRGYHSPRGNVSPINLNRGTFESKVFTETFAKRQLRCKTAVPCSAPARYFQRLMRGLVDTNHAARDFLSGAGKQHRAFRETKPQGL